MFSSNIHIETFSLKPSYHSISGGSRGVPWVLWNPPFCRFACMSRRPRARARAQSKTFWTADPFKILDPPLPWNITVVIGTYMWLSRIPGHFYIYCTSHSTAHLHDRLGKHVFFRSFSHDRNGNRNTKQMLRTIFWVYIPKTKQFLRKTKLCAFAPPLHARLFKCGPTAYTQQALL